MGTLITILVRLLSQRKPSYYGFALLCLAILLTSKGQAQAQETAEVWLQPQTLSLNQGQKNSVVVRIESAANLYGVQIELFFDAAKIKILDANQAKAGIQIHHGDLLPFDEAFVAANEANNEIGTLTYALTLLAPAEPAAGSGTLIEFEVEALQDGDSELLLDTVILASPDGELLPWDLGDDQPTATATSIIVPTALPTIVPTSTVTVKDEPILSTVTPTTASPVVVASATTAVAASITAAAAPPTASPAAETTPPATAAAETGLAPTSELPTGTIPVQTAEAVPDPAAVEPAAEIAAVTQGPEEAGAVQVDERPSPALTVIGQNSSIDELQTPAAPDATNEAEIAGSTLAISLLLALVVLIALLYWRRSK